MAMYALALVPLFKQLQPYCKQVWCADDATGCDEFIKLRKWSDVLEKGPMYGYFPKPSKCILITKLEHVARANEIFRDSGIDAVAFGCKESGISVEEWPGGEIVR